jgi:phosphoribosylglycinamide formyltransferase 1
VKIGVLASHEGTTLQAVLDACASGSLPARVVLVISNNSGSGALRRAAAAGVPARHLSGAAYPDPADLDVAICDALLAAPVDLVFLGGYMKRLGPKVLSAFSGRILNTHPALLPKFGGEGMYGMNVHRAVIAAGERESGASVHLVDGEYDTGTVLEQRRVPVEPDDTPETLAARVQECERALVVDVFRELATGRRVLPAQGGMPRA